MKALFKSRYVISIFHMTCYLSEKEISLVRHDLFLANISWPLLIILLFPIHKRKLCLVICFNIFPAIQVRLFAYIPQAFFFFKKKQQTNKPKQNKNAKQKNPKHLGAAITCFQSSIPQVLRERITRGSRIASAGFLCTLSRFL